MATKTLELVWFIDHLPGERLFFEYHCWEDQDSADADLWLRSHQRVTVVAREVNDGAGLSWRDRMESGQQYTYHVLFDDGSTGTVFEDELSPTPDTWTRLDPPGYAYTLTT